MSRSGSSLVIVIAGVSRGFIAGRYLVWLVVGWSNEQGATHVSLIISVVMDPRWVCTVVGNYIHSERDSHHLPAM